MTTKQKQYMKPVVEVLEQLVLELEREQITKHRALEKLADSLAIVDSDEDRIAWDNAKFCIFGDKDPFEA